MLRSKLTLLNNLISCSHMLTIEAVLTTLKKIKYLKEEQQQQQCACVFQGKQLICLASNDKHGVNKGPLSC